MPQSLVSPLLTQLGECISDLVMIVDRDGVIIYANRGRGLVPKETLIGQNLKTFYVPDQIAAAQLALTKVFEGARNTLLKVEGRTPDGLGAHYSQLLNPLFEGSKIVGAILVESDITEKLSLIEEIEIEKAKALHATKFAALGEMASGIAHEINSPLSHIQLLSSMQREHLESVPADIPQARTIGDQIEATVQRISKIIRGLRTFARQCEGEPFCSTSVASIVEETLDLMREKLRVAEVELRLNLVSHDVMVECRSTQICQILLNLCSNAVDASENLDERWIQIEVKDLGISVEISVSDNGSGIAPEVRDRLMQPFFTAKAQGKGTGLGLSISRSIAALHNGLLYLDQAAARTRFVLLLPKQQSAKVA